MTWLPTLENILLLHQEMGKSSPWPKGLPMSMR